MKRISVLSIALALVFISFAQYPPKFGVKAGVNISSTNNSRGNQPDSKVGWHAGLLAHVHLTPQWSIQPEMTYSGQGAKYIFGNAEHKLNLNYLTIPVLLQYNFDNGFRAQTGPQLGLLLNVTDKVNGSETGRYTSDDFKNVDFSWAFGLGYLFYSGFGIDGRYNLGISNINDRRVGTIKNSIFQLGFFYLFDHTHKARSR